MAKPQPAFHLPKTQRRLVSLMLGGYLILLVNSFLLLLFDRSTAGVYMSSVLLHVVLGLLLVPPVLYFLFRHLRTMPLRRNLRAAAAGSLTAGSLLVLLGSGIGLVGAGATYAGGWVLGAHLTTALTTIAAFGLHVSMKRGVRYHFLGWRAQAGATLRHPLSLTLIAGGVLLLGSALWPWLSGRSTFVETSSANPLAEAQAVLAHDGFLGDTDLGRSASCGQAGCHPDVFAQWTESAHRFSSFNNPYYRASIEAMVERKGNGPTRWCASCHDPLVLFSGRFSTEAPVDMDHATAQAGLTCLSCHAIEGLRDLKGNGRYVMAAPDEYPLARSDNPLGTWLHNRLVRSKPEPHRNAMLKPMHRTQEFCGSCHKVSLPPGVNAYRWKRGQNEYDAWQASGTSGNTVRSFYLPPAAQTCTSCHMPLVPSTDQGNDGGFIRSHRFASANTALPFLNGHTDQLHAAQRALTDSIASVDLFAATVNGRFYGPTDPLPTLKAGDEVRLTAVVRNRKVGHGLPGGTNDSNELWLELLAEDAQGGVVRASGTLNAQGQVDSTAHFWGAVLVDKASQAIDKRNAHDWRATVYANVIGPGTAHTVHYRFRVPQGPPPTQFTARLRYRKFKWYFNQWSFRGEPAPNQPDSLAANAVDRRKWILNDTQAPDLPVTDLARQTRRLAEPAPSTRPLWERWNDYGIGLLLEGDTRGAVAAFETVARLAPDNPEGPLNQARVLLIEGQHERAGAQLTLAEQRRPGYLKTAYFRGEWYKDQGLYEEALSAWMRVEAAYPADRVLLLGIGRMHYLLERYTEALTWFDRVLAIDPEHIAGLYNRMLCLGALDQQDAFAEARARYLYHKDDETAQALTTPFKRAHPAINLEAQAIHEHPLERLGVERSRF